MTRSRLWRIGRRIAAPWRWVLLQEAREHRRQKNDARIVRKAFAALSHQIIAAEKLRLELAARRPTFRLTDGELVPLTPVSTAESEGGHCD